MKNRILTFDEFINEQKLNEGKPFPTFKPGGETFKKLYDIWALINGISNNLDDYLNIRAGATPSKEARGIEPKFFIDMILENIQDIEKRGGLKALNDLTIKIAEEDKII